MNYKIKINRIKVKLKKIKKIRRESPEFIDFCFQRNDKRYSVIFRRFRKAHEKQSIVYIMTNRKRGTQEIPVFAGMTRLEGMTGFCRSGGRAGGVG